MEKLKEYTFTKHAMGSTFSISLVCKEEETAKALFSEAETIVQEYEQRFSRFLPESELSRINASRGGVVSDTFMEVLLCARHLFLITHGAFNPCVQIRRLGYTTSFSEPWQDEPPTKKEPYNADFSQISIDEKKKIISLPEGACLDFGGFLKGFVAEKIACAFFSHRDVRGIIVNIGGDLFTLGNDERDTPFTFTIFNPITQKDDISLTVHNGALATSGTYKRIWEKEGKKMHHILDATGTHNPHTDIVSASALAPDGALAEAYATLLIIKGYEHACNTLGVTALSCVLIKKTGEVEHHMIY